MTFKILPRPLLSQVNHEVQVEELISVYDRDMQNRMTEIESETASFEAEREEMRQLEDYSTGMTVSPARNLSIES